MAVAGEVARRNGWESAAWLMREYNRVPAAQARSEASLAYTLAAEDLTETVTALSEGEITLSHARVVARAARKEHTKPEAELLELARAYPSDVVGRHTLAYESAETHAAEAAGRQAKEDAKYGTGPAADELRAQRAARRGRMVLGEDGMWHLSASFDAITGRRVHQIYEAALRAMRNRPGSADHTHAQRGADVVAELFGGHSDCHPPAGHPAGAGRLRPRLRPPRQPAPRRRHPDSRRGCRRARDPGPGHAGALRRQLAEHRRRHQPQPQRSPTPPARGPRRRLHRLPRPHRRIPSAPHPVLGGRRPHPRSQPRPPLSHLPRPRPRAGLPRSTPPPAGTPNSDPPTTSASPTPHRQPTPSSEPDTPHNAPTGLGTEPPAPGTTEPQQAWIPAPDRVRGRLFAGMPDRGRCEEDRRPSGGASGLRGRPWRRWRAPPRRVTPSTRRRGWSSPGIRVPRRTRPLRPGPCRP